MHKKPLINSHADVLCEATGLILVLSIHLLSYFVHTRSKGSYAPFLLAHTLSIVKLLLSKRPKISFQDQLSLNAGQKYCRMLQGEHSAILLTYIKLPYVIKIFVLPIFEWPFYTGFTVPKSCVPAYMIVI